MGLVFGRNDPRLAAYFINDNVLRTQIEQRIGNLSPGNAVETLDFVNQVLSENPDLLQVHLLRAHTLLHGLGRVKEAYEEYIYISRICNEINESAKETPRFARVIDDLMYQVNDVALPLIRRDFAPLRFKIKGKKINKFCHIVNMKVLITFDENVYGYGNDPQKLRLDYLKGQLESGEMKFQISAYDSVDNRYYFEIPFFPLIDAPGIREPYAIILNNKKRYHFRIDHQYNEIIEISWNDEWELVESVPNDLIKFEFPAEYSLLPHALETQQALRGIFSIPEPESDMENLYVPTREVKEMEIVLEQENKSKYIGKILVHTTRIVIGVFIVWAFVFVRA